MSRSVVRIILVAFVLFISRSVLWAQTNVEQYKSDKIIPPSPNAASLGNYGNYAQGTYNGIPSIMVPLYSTKAAGLSLDFTLSYDASGIKPLQDASAVGLGWALSYGGGVITRQVRGIDDFKPTVGYLGSGALPDATIWGGKYRQDITSANNLGWYFDNIRINYYDAEPDIFTFSMGPYSGRFVLDKTANGGKVLELDQTNLRITHDGQNSWTITDGNGYTYLFSTQETTEDYTYSQPGLSDDSPLSAFNDENNERYPIVTAWYLDQITAPDGETISFEYEYDYSLSSTMKYEQDYLMLSMQGTCDGGSPLPSYQKNECASKQSISGRMISRIVFDNGSIEFSNAPRDDIQSPYNGMSPKRYSQILVKDKLGGLIKKLAFTHTYFTDFYGYKRLKLDAVQEFSPTGEAIPAWQFTYFNPDMLPPKYTKGIDHWGFYNEAGNNTLLPAKYVQSMFGRWYNFDGANRRPSINVDAVRNGVLKSITYPTGGKTNFDFELNEYTNLYDDEKFDVIVHNPALQSGPIGQPTEQHDQQVTFTLTQTQDVVFVYNVTDIYQLGLPTDLVNFYAGLWDANDHLMTMFPTYDVTGTYINSQTMTLGPGTYILKVLAMEGYVTGVTATWQEQVPVAQRKGGGLRIKRIENIDNTGGVSVKTYQYNNGAQSTGLQLNPVKYDYRIEMGQGEYHPDPTGSVYCNFLGEYLVRQSSSIQPQGFSFRGGIIGYSKVTETLGEHGENGKIEYYFKNEAVFPPYTPSIPVNNNPLNGKLDSMLVYDATGKLVKKTETTYGINQTASIQGIKMLPLAFSLDNYQIFYYDNESAWTVEATTKETEYTQNGAMINAVTSYYDNAIHKQLTKRDRLLSDNTLLTEQFKYPHDFQNTGTPNVYNEMVLRNMINPVVEKTTWNNTTTFVESIKNNYDFWSGSAWATTPQNNRIFLRTIESKTGGAASKTQLRLYTYDQKGNAGSFAKDNDVVKTYIWGYNYTYPVAEVVGASYNDVMGVLDAAVIQNPASDQAMRSELQKIRQQFPAAMVTTYTYKPLVGITSQTDARNRTSYYEYDGFSRLKLLRDQEGNIVRTFKYNYKQ